MSTWFAMSCDILVGLVLPFFHDLTETLQPAGNDSAVATPGLGPSAGQIEVFYRSFVGKASGHDIIQCLIPAVDRSGRRVSSTLWMRISAILTFSFR